MKQITSFIFYALIFLVFTIAHAEEAPDSVKQLVPTLQDWGNNNILINAVKSQNATGMSLSDIQARDKEWRAVTGLDDSMKAMMNSNAAKELLKLESSKPYFTEVFLMDNQGANVAMTNKTSDYWQGDEGKFTESFANGTGAVHIGDVEFDESAQAYLVQISVPVMEDGAAIGAITIGVNLDNLEK